MSPFHKEDITCKILNSNFFTYNITYLGFVKFWHTLSDFCQVKLSASSGVLFI